MKNLAKSIDKKATDPVDKMIFEQGLKAKNLIIDKELDMMLLVLSNGSVLKSRISDYPKLMKASKKQLNNWQFTGGGVGIEWSSIDEDLSIKGFIKTSAINELLTKLQTKHGLLIEA